MARKNGFIFLLSIVSLLLGGCSEKLFDEVDVLSFHEHLSDLSKGADVLNAMDKALIEKTILVGGYDASFHRTDKPNWASSEKLNIILTEAKLKAPDRIDIFPLIRGDENNLLTYLKELIKKGARGFFLCQATERFRNMPLTDRRLAPFFAWCELHRIPLLFQVEYESYGDEFENIMRDYPNLWMVASHMLTLTSDLERLGVLLDRYPNLILDASFGWEKDKKKHIKDLAEDIDSTREFFIQYKDRIVFGTNVIVAPGPGRNVDWLSQYYLDLRRFFERKNVRLKLLLNKQSTLHKLPGLHLPKQVLKAIYHDNYDNLLGKEMAEFNKYNLDHLIIKIDPSAKYNEKSSYRLITALVTNHTNPAEGMFSAWLRNVFEGKTTNWQDLSGIDLPIQVIAFAPLHEWIPTRLKIEKPIYIRPVKTIEEIERILQQNPGTLALIPFDQIKPTMKVLPVDGETPTGRYIRDCTKRGAATIGTYFYSYPLLFPVAMRAPVPADIIFNPYQIRSLVISERFVPQSLPATTDAETDPAIAPVYKINTLLTSTDIVLSMIDAPLQDNCLAATDGRPKCIDSTWLKAFDFTGIDVIALSAGQLPAQPLQNTRDLLDRHSITLIGQDDETAATLSVRGKDFSFLTYHADNVQSEQIEGDVKKRLADGKEVFVFIIKPTSLMQAGDESISSIARSAVEAGSTAVLITGDAAPGKIQMWPKNFLVHSLGRLQFSESAEENNVTFLVQFTYYQNRFIALNLTALRWQENKLHPTHTADARQQAAGLFEIMR